MVPTQNVIATARRSVRLAACAAVLCVPLAAQGIASRVIAYPAGTVIRVKDGQPVKPSVFTANPSPLPSDLRIVDMRDRGGSAGFRLFDYGLAWQMSDKNVEVVALSSNNGQQHGVSFDTILREWLKVDGYVKSGLLTNEYAVVRSSISMNSGTLTVGEGCDLDFGLKVTGVTEGGISADVDVKSTSKHTVDVRATDPTVRFVLASEPSLLSFEEKWLLTGEHWQVAFCDARWGNILDAAGKKHIFRDSIQLTCWLTLKSDLSTQVSTPTELDISLPTPPKNWAYTYSSGEAWMESADGSRNCTLIRVAVHPTSGALRAYLWVDVNQGSMQIRSFNAINAKAHCPERAIGPGSRITLQASIGLAPLQKKVLK
jgi:hypothetical protein